MKAGWPELMEMLQNGEIDLMGDVSYTPERAEGMLFSELPMGKEKYYLYADLENTGISESNIQIVAMTANVFDEDRKKVLSVGMNDHVAKPIDIKKLETILLQILRKS